MHYRPASLSWGYKIIVLKMFCFINKRKLKKDYQYSLCIFSSWLFLGNSIWAFQKQSEPKKDLAHTNIKNIRFSVCIPFYLHLELFNKFWTETELQIKSYNGFSCNQLLYFYWFFFRKALILLDQSKQKYYALFTVTAFRREQN